MGGDNAAAKKFFGWSMATAIFGLTAFILMWLASARCDFIKFVSTGGSSEPVVREFGIWYFQFFSYVVSTDGRFIVETCNSYPAGTDYDSAWKAARVFSSLTAIFAITILVVRSFQACSSDPTKRYRANVVGPLYLLTALFQGLTLLLLSSNACKNNELVEMAGIEFEETCGLARGANLSISAMVFWLAAAVSSFQEHKAFSEVSEQLLRTGAQPPTLNEPLNP